MHFTPSCCIKIQCSNVKMLITINVWIIEPKYEASSIKSLTSDVVCFGKRTFSIVRHQKQCAFVDVLQSHRFCHLHSYQQNTRGP